MDRNVIITGGAGNLGRVVVEKFKREGYKVALLNEILSPIEILGKIEYLKSSVIEILNKGC